MSWGIEQLRTAIFWVIKQRVVVLLKQCKLITAPRKANHRRNCTNTAVNNQRRPPILHTRLERTSLSQAQYDKDQQSAKKRTITYKNINNPHISIWATRLRGYT